MTYLLHHMLSLVITSLREGLIRYNRSPWFILSELGINQIAFLQWIRAFILDSTPLPITCNYDFLSSNNLYHLITHKYYIIILKSALAFLLFITYTQWSNVCGILSVVLNRSQNVIHARTHFIILLTHTSHIYLYST